MKNSIKREIQTASTYRRLILKLENLRWRCKLRHLTYLRTSLVIRRSSLITWGCHTQVCKCLWKSIMRETPKWELRSMNTYRSSKFKKDTHNSYTSLSRAKISYNLQKSLRELASLTSTKAYKRCLESFLQFNNVRRNSKISINLIMDSWRPAWK